MRTILKSQFLVKFGQGKSYVGVLKMRLTFLEAKSSVENMLVVLFER